MVREFPNFSKERIVSEEDEAFVQKMHYWLFLKGEIFT